MAREEQEKQGAVEPRDEAVTGKNKCPECGQPVEELRATCPNCGYEYKDSDYSEEGVGTEFTAGSLVDDEGDEITDIEATPAPEPTEEQEEEA